MILSLAIATGALAVLDDQDLPNLEELFQWAILLKNPRVVLDALTLEQKQQLEDQIAAWISSSPHLPALKERIDTATWLFETLFTTPNPPTFGGPDIVYVDKRSIEHLNLDELEQLRRDVEDESKEPVRLQGLEDLLGIREIREVLSWSQTRILLGVDAWDDDGEYKPEVEEIDRAIVAKHANDDKPLFTQNRDYILGMIDSCLLDKRQGPYGT